MGRRYAIIYTDKSREAYEAAQRARQLLKRGETSIEVYSASKLVDEKLPAELDLVIALGGDGTILKTLGALSRWETPILGINFGRGGFLAEVESDKLEDALKKILAGEYETERKLMISIRVNGEKIGDAFNEAYIGSQIMGKTLHLEILRNEVRLAEGLADGLIVSTPAGSTAYAFSAGGPIVDDSLEGVVLAPICPITGLRPMVLSLKHELQILASGDYGIAILLDGYNLKKFDEKSIRIRVERSERLAVFIRLGLGESFARRVRKKLC